MLKEHHENVLETPHLNQTTSIAGEVFRAAAIAGTEPARVGITAVIKKIASSTTGMVVLTISAMAYPFLLVRFAEYLMPWGLLPFVIAALVYGLKLGRGK